jgi:tetratricopeptide (TPR) repeat protein
MKVIALTLLLAGFGAVAASAQPPAPPAAAAQAQPSNAIAEAYNQFLLAQRLQEDNDVAGAIDAYKRASALDPSAAEIVSDLAGLYLRENRGTEAIAAAEQALAIDSDNAQAHRVLGMIYASRVTQGERGNRQREASRDNIALAVRHLEAAIARPVGTPDANIRAMLSRLYITAGDFDKAIATLAELVKQEPGWQEGASLLVQAYAAAGRSEEAVAFLEQAVDDNPRLYATLADFYGRQDRWQEAAQTYAQGLEASPRNFDLKVGYGSALLNLGGATNAMMARDALVDAVAMRGEDQRALFLLSQAQRLSGDLDDAEGTARRLIGVNRNSTRGYVALAEALEERQRYQAVIDALAPIVAEFRSNASAAPALRSLLPHLGFAYQQLGKGESAVESFQEALKLSPGDPRLTVELIQAQLAAKNYTGALDAVRSARSERPDDLIFVRLEAQALRESGRTDQSIAVLQDLVRRQADNPEAHIALAQGYARANRGNQAVQVLRDAQSKFPQEGRIIFELGATFDKQKRFADAEAAFRELLAREPQNALALNYLGYILADRGERLDESVSLLQRALQIEPENGSYLDSLGWAYYKVGKLDLAEDNLRRAANRMATNSVIQDHYGDLLFKLGRYDDAIAAWTRALEGDGDAIDRGDIDRKIKSARQKLGKK